MANTIRPTVTLEEIQAAADLADRMVADVDYAVEQAHALANAGKTKDEIRGVNPDYILHGSWAIEERRYWQEVARRLRAIVLQPA